MRRCFPIIGSLTPPLAMPVIRCRFSPYRLMHVIVFSSVFSSNVSSALPQQLEIVKKKTSSASSSARSHPSGAGAETANRTMSKRVSLEPPSRALELAENQPGGGALD